MAQTNSQLPTTVIPNTTVGTDWLTPNNILLADGEFAVSGGSSQILTVGNFPINLVQGDTITNIVFAVKGYRGSFNTTLQIFAVDDTSGVPVSYPLLPAFQGFNGTNTLYTLPATLFATTWTVNQINNIKIKLIADGELHLDYVTLNVVYTPAATQTIYYNTLVGTFVAGDVITGGTSGATATIVTVGTGQLDVNNVDGVFVVGETITGVPSGATAVVTTNTTSGQTIVDEFVQAQPFQLAQSMTSSDLFMFLNSFNYPDGTPIPFTDFYGDAMLVIDQGIPGKEENVQITAVDHDYQGTGVVRISFGTLSNRGLRFHYPYSADSTLRQDHSGTAEVVISNNAPFYSRFLKTGQIDALVSAPIEVEDEGVSLTTSLHNINFAGAGVTATLVAPHEVLVTIPGGGSGGQAGIQFQDEGTNLGTSGTADVVNFTGAGVTASRASNTVTVNITGGGGAGYDTIQSVGTPVAQEDTINFSTLFTVADDPSVATDVDIDVIDLGNDTTFITTLTNNSLFQTNVNNFISNGSGGTKLAIDTTEVTVANTATETSLFSETVDGGILGTNNAVRFKTHLSNLEQNSGVNQDLFIRLKYGAQQLLLTVDTPNNLVNTNGGYIEGWIVADGTTGTQKTWVTLYTTSSDGEQDGDSTVNISKVQGTASGAMTVDSSTDQTIEVTVQWESATVASTITSEFTVIEKISDGSGGTIIQMIAAESLAIGDPVGVSSIDADNVALANWFSKSVSIDGTGNGFRSAAYIGSNRYVVVYDAGGTGTGGAAIVEIDRATMTMTTLFSNGSILGAIDSIYVCSLGTVDKFLICYTEDGVNNGLVQVCDWDGVTINQGTPVTVQGGGDWVGGQCCNMGTDRAACIFQDQPGNGNSVFMITVSGTVPTAAANDTFGSSAFSDATTVSLQQIDTEKFVVATSGSVVKAYEFTAPSTLTGGSVVAIATGDVSLASAIDGNFIAVIGSPGYSIQYCSVSGTTITIEDTVARSSVPAGSVICINSTTFYMYQSNNTVGTSGLYQVNISGGNTIDTPIIIASRVLPSTSGQLLYMATQGYFVILENGPITDYFIEGMSGNFIGIAQGSASRGGSVSVLIKGVDTNQTTKIAGVIYEVIDGTLTATLDITVPFKVIGQSATEVII